MKRSKILVFWIMITCLLVASSLLIPRNTSQETVTTTEEAPLLIGDTDPYYNIRIPTAYDVSGQAGLVVYGNLSSLAFENTTMQFRRNFASTSTGTTHATFAFSMAGVTLDPDYSLTINFEVHGYCSVGIANCSSKITVYILYQRTTWVPIFTRTAATDLIHRVNGWGEYIVPLPFNDYLEGTNLQVKVELTQQLTAPQTWTQRLYVRWLLLELRKDVGLNEIAPTRVTLLTPGFASAGNVSSLGSEDACCYQFDRELPPGGETGQLQVLLEYSLGYYSLEPLLGVRFAHNEWLHIEGTSDISMVWTNGRIALNGSAGNQFLCLMREELLYHTTPDIRHACMPLRGDWRSSNSIRLLYTINYSIESAAATVHFLIDWARLQIVRQPHPLIIAELLNFTIEATERVWLNLTCFEGKAPIAEIRILPWDELVGSTAGAYLYNHLTERGGEFALSLNITDAEGDQYIRPIGTLNVLYRQTSIALYLSEDPYHQELIIQLSIRDISANALLPQHPFTKTILKNGTWFREQIHETTTSGTFTIHEPLAEYLDWNYTVIIEAQRTPIHEAASVRASLVLSQCPPVVTINCINFSQPVKANDLILVNYTVTCLTPLEALWLCRNESLFRPLIPSLGTHNFTFHDVGGAWEYRLYANNSRHFQVYSPPFRLQIIPLKTALQLESSLDLDSHAIAIEIRLYDELNRTCTNVPLKVTIFDQGEKFYDQQVTTGLDGVALIIHFDQYLDHSFMIQIMSDSTPLYNGAMLTAGDLAYQGFPLYWLLQVGFCVGCVTVSLLVIRRQIRIRK